MKILLTLPILALFLLQEAPPDLIRCANDGTRGKKGEFHSCACLMACTPDEDPHGLGDGTTTKCATYCRKDKCTCKVPCA